MSKLKHLQSPKLMLLPRCFVFLTNGLQLTISSWHPLQGTASCCLLWKKGCKGKIEHWICHNFWPSIRKFSILIPYAVMVIWSTVYLQQMKFICMFLRGIDFLRLKWDSQARTKRNLFRFRWVLSIWELDFLM